MSEEIPDDPLEFRLIKKLNKQFGKSMSIWLLTEENVVLDDTYTPAQLRAIADLVEEYKRESNK